MSEPTAFDPAKALREEIQGLNDVLKVAQNATTQYANEYTVAEMKHNAMTKVVGFVSGELARKRAELNKLMEQ